MNKYDDKNDLSAGAKIALGVLAITTAVTSKIGIDMMMEGEGTLLRTVPFLIAIGLFFYFYNVWADLIRSGSETYDDTLSGGLTVGIFVLFLPIVMVVSTMTSAIGVVGNAAVRISVDEQLPNAQSYLSSVGRIVAEYGTQSKEIATDGQRLEELGIDEMNSGRLSGSSGPGGLSGVLISAGKAKQLFAANMTRRHEQASILMGQARKALEAITELVANENGQPVSEQRHKILLHKAVIVKSVSKIEGIISPDSLKSYAQSLPSMIILTSPSRKKRFRKKQQAFVDAERMRQEEQAARLVETAERLMNMLSSKTAGSGLFPIVTMFEAVLQNRFRFVPQLAMLALNDLAPTIFGLLMIVKTISRRRRERVIPLAKRLSMADGHEIYQLWQEFIPARPEPLHTTSTAPPGNEENTTNGHSSKMNGFKQPATPSSEQTDRRKDSVQ